jgi:hypothetical protein
MACQPNSTDDILKHPAIVYTVGIYSTTKLFKIITKKDFYTKQLQSNTNQLVPLGKSLVSELLPAIQTSRTVMDKTGSKSSGFVTAVTHVACSEIDDYCNISHNIIDNVNSILDYYYNSETIKNASHFFVKITIPIGIGLLKNVISAKTGMLFHDVTKL